MSVRRWLGGGIAALAVTIVTTVTACGGGDDQVGVERADVAGRWEERGPITLATGKDVSGNLRKRLDAWNSTHPAENVRLIELPESADAQRQQMVQNAQTRSGTFTILNVDVVWISEFAAHHWLAELPKGRFDLSGFLRPAVQTATYYDRLYAVPLTSDGGLLYYRKDLLKKAGIDGPPKTWDEMWADCRKVLKPAEAKGVSCYAGQFEKYEGLTVNFAEAVNGAGGVITDDRGRPNVDTPEAKKGLDYIVNAMKSGYISREALTYKEEEGRRAFQAGRLVFHRQWPYQWAPANKTDGSSKVAGRFGVALLPGAAGPGVSSLGGHNLAISAFAGNKATALDFITFLTGEEQQRANLLATSSAPTRASLYDDPELVRRFPYLPFLKRSILGARPRPKVVRYGETTVAVQEQAYDAISGRKSTGQALADLQHELEGLLR